MPIVVAVEVVLVVAGWIAIGFVPVWIAKARKHKREDAVFNLTLLALFFPPLWIAALVWSIVGEEFKKPVPRISQRFFRENIDDAVRENFEG